MKVRQVRTQTPLPAEREFFERLYRDHYAKLFAYVARRAGVDHAHDVVADTFLVAWRKLHSVPSEPFPWLIGIARNQLANHDRSARRRQRLRSRVEAYAPRGETGDGDEAAPEKQKLALAFSRLSGADREILALLAWEELSLKEVSVALGVSSVACRVRFHRAKERLKAQMQAVDRQTCPTPVPSYGAVKEARSR